ncbi:unnamed protein product, partial [Mesorhabditis spiculigera]
MPRALIIFLVLAVLVGTADADWLDNVFDWLGNAARDSADWVGNKALPKVQDAFDHAHRWVKNRVHDTKDWWNDVDDDGYNGPRYYNGQQAYQPNEGSYDGNNDYNPRFRR